MTIWVRLLLGTLYSVLASLFLTKADGVRSCLKYGLGNYWKDAFIMWFCIVGVFVCMLMLIALVFT